jgi:hypothetical protein
MIIYRCKKVRKAKKQHVQEKQNRPLVDGRYGYGDAYKHRTFRNDVRNEWKHLLRIIAVNK